MKTTVYFPRHESVDESWAFGVLSRARHDWIKDRGMRVIDGKVNSDYRRITEQWSYEIELINETLE